MSADPTFWNKLADKYAAQPVADPAAFDRKTGITRALIAPDHTVLGVGCGTGSLLLRLAPTGADLVGLDLSSEMVRIAEGKRDAAGADNVRFEVGPFDETFTSFAPGTLDGVLAFSILHLLEDLPAALARIHDLLRPGGFFVSSTVTLGDTWMPLGAVVRVMRWLGKAPYVATLSTDQLLRDIEAAGFVDVQLTDVGATSSTVAFIVARKP